MAGFDEQAIALLNEIAQRQTDQIAKGILRSTKFTVGTEWYPVTLGAWISAYGYNDGDADLYVRINNTEGKPWEQGEAEIKKGEMFQVDLRGKRPKGEREPPVLFFICETGTATVRFFQLF